MTHENVIEMREITKIFGEFVANDKINLELRKGEIHALLGENGAGKSTLMNMLAGLLEPTSGEIVVNGKSVKLDSPSKAAHLVSGWCTSTLCLLKLLLSLKISSLEVKSQKMVCWT